MIGALTLASAIPQILSGFVANSQHKTQSDLLSGMELDMPTGIKDAENILRENAASGLPGYEKYKGDIKSTMATGLSAYKDVIDNPAAILGALSSSQTSMNESLADLAIKDAMVKLENEKSLASFLGGTKAGAEMQIDQYGDQMKIAAGEERMLGSAELLQGITSGIGAGITTFGGMKQLDYTKELLGNMSNYWNKSTSQQMPAGITPEMIQIALKAGLKL